MLTVILFFFFFSSRRRHTRFDCDWSSDVCLPIFFGAQRSAAWRELTWDKSLARGPEKNIRTWGQLGLTGEWADKPIHVYGYNLQFYFPQEIESRVFGGVSGKWNENLVEYDNLLRPDGSFKLAGQLMLEDLAKEPYGIAYCAGGNAWLTPQIKAIALSIKDG